MPTIKPRIAVTLDSESHEAVRYLSLATGRSMSAIIAELVQSIHPVLTRTADVVQAAKRAQDDQKQGLVRALHEAEQSLHPALLQAGIASEKAFGAIERAASPATGAQARRGRRGSLDPRPSNTGVRLRKVLVSKGRGLSGKRGRK